MSEHVEVTVTVLVPRDVLNSQVVTREDIAQVAQAHVDSAVAEHEDMMARVARMAQLRKRLRGFQL